MLCIHLVLEAEKKSLRQKITASLQTIELKLIPSIRQKIIFIAYKVFFA